MPYFLYFTLGLAILVNITGTYINYRVFLANMLKRRYLEKEKEQCRESADHWLNAKEKAEEALDDFLSKIEKNLDPLVFAESMNKFSGSKVDLHEFVRLVADEITFRRKAVPYNRKAAIAAAKARRAEKAEKDRIDSVEKSPKLHR